MSDIVKFSSTQYKKKSKKHFDGIKQDYIDQEKQSLYSYNPQMSDSYDDYKKRFFKKSVEPIQNGVIPLKKPHEKHDKYHQYSYFEQKPEMKFFNKQKIVKNNPTQHSEQKKKLDQQEKILLQSLNLQSQKEQNIKKQNQSQKSDLKKGQEIQQQDLQSKQEIKENNQYADQDNIDNNSQDLNFPENLNKCPQNEEQLQEKNYKEHKYNQQFLNVNEIGKQNNKKIVIEVLKNHKDYLDHISGKCICYTCQCNMMCKCGFKKMIIIYKQKYTSQYDMDYLNQKKSKEQSILIKREDAFDLAIKLEEKNIDSIKPLDMQISPDYYKSVNQNDYTEFLDLKANKRFRDQKYQQKKSIDYLTSNKVEYLPKSSEVINCYDSQKKPTVLQGVKFQGQSMYKSQFEIPKLEDDEFTFFASRQSTIPLKNNFPFTATSINSGQFSRKSVDRDRFRIYPEGNLTCLDTLSYMYTTTSQRYFQQQNVNSCRK